MNNSKFISIIMIIIIIIIMITLDTVITAHVETSFEYCPVCISYPTTCRRSLIGGKYYLYHWKLFAVMPSVLSTIGKYFEMMMGSNVILHAESSVSCPSRANSLKELTS
jgi:hypothetical protein